MQHLSVQSNAQHTVAYSPTMLPQKQRGSSEAYLFEEYPACILYILAVDQRAVPSGLAQDSGVPDFSLFWVSNDAYIGTVVDDEPPSCA